MTQRPTIFVAVVLGCLAALWFVGGDREVAPFLGTWTDDQGEAGNYIRFELVPIEQPQTPVVTLLEGWVTLHKLEGHAELRRRWTYEDSNAIRIWVDLPEGARLATLTMVDDDHMLVGFEAPQAEEQVAPKPKQLRRIAHPGENQ